MLKASCSRERRAVSSLTGAAVAFPGIVLVNGKNWSTKASTSLTAVSLADAIAKNIPWLSTSTTSNAITITARVAGAYYNTMGVSCKNTNITVATALMSGGQDNASLQISGTVLKANQDFYPGTTPTTAATAIAAAINANTYLTTYIVGTANDPTAGIVALASKGTGANRNFELMSSTPAALTVSGTTMTGGSGSN